MRFINSGSFMFLKRIFSLHTPASPSIFSVLLLMLLLSAAGMRSVYATEWQPLHDRVLLWDQIEQGLEGGLKHSIEVSKASSQLKYVLVKTIAGTLRFEHYDTQYQGYPVLNGRIVLVKNKAGQTQQVLGASVTGLVADLPNAAESFTQDKHAVRTWLLRQYQVDSSITHLELYPAIYIDAGLAKPVYRLSFLRLDQHGLSLERPQMIVDAQSLKILKQWDALDKVQSPVPTEGQQVIGGGAGGNELLGLNCYTPSPDLMTQCLSYQGIDDPLVTEVSFQNNDPNNIYSEFSGYPFIVTKSEGDCWLKNEYVTTIKALRDTPSDSAFQFSCGNDNEHFEKQSIDDNYWNYFSYFPINDAHFYAGIVMQMYDQYLREIYPIQLEDCPPDSSNGYCLKPISQRANAKGQTGGDMSNANWDGEYVNYGNGGPGDLYSQTTIDIVAHEISHAITEWNSDPIWEGQSRALDESFSDIAAMAVNDYFERQVSGSYATSVPYENKRNKRWVYGWDVFYYIGGRDFQLPSRDGRSIDDGRDYEKGMSGHVAGGVMNKLFYELVVRHGWSIEETFKLMLEANVSCWSTQVVFADAGTCLLLLTEDVDKLSQLEQTLHAVGIFSPQSSLNVLPFNLQQQGNRVEFQVVLPANILPELITAIDISWGDFTLDESWLRDSGIALESYLSAAHDYVDDGDRLLSIKLSLADGSDWFGYRNVFIAADLVPTKDLSPNPFTLQPQANVPIAVEIYSQAIIVTGINTATAIQLDGGEYAIDGGDFTSEPGRVMNGQQVVLKLISSAAYQDTRLGVLTIGDVSSTFEVTTVLAPSKSRSAGMLSFLEILLLLAFFALFHVGNSAFYMKLPFKTSIPRRSVIK